MSWLDRLLGNTTKSGNEPGDVKAADSRSAALPNWEARRLLREAFGEQRFRGEKRLALLLAKGAAAYRLAPDIPEAVYAQAVMLRHAGPEEEVSAFARDNWPRAGDQHRMELLANWLATALRADKSGGIPDHLVRWTQDPARAGRERALFMALLAGRFPGTHALQLLRAVIEVAPWDAAIILTAARPALAEFEQLALFDRAYLLFHLFRVSGDRSVGITLAGLAAALGAIDQSVAIRQALSEAAGGDAEQLHDAAATLVMAGRYDEALAAASIAADLAPGMVNTLSLQAYALGRLGRETEAESIVRNLEQVCGERLGRSLEPESRRVAVRELLWFHATLRPDETRLTELAAEARELGIPGEEIARARGASLCHAGRLAEAVELLHHERIVGPAADEAALLRARALLRLGRRDDARTLLAENLDLLRINTRRHEMEILLRELDGSLPEEPELVRNAREFLENQTWDFLDVIRDIGRSLSLRMTSISPGDGLDESPEAVVQIRNESRSPIPLSREGLLGGRLYVYGHGVTTRGTTLIFADLTSRDLGEFVSLDPGAGIEVRVALDADVQGQFLFVEKFVDGGAGWLVAAILGDRDVPAFDSWFLSRLALPGRDSEFDSGGRFTMDTHLRRRVAMSPVARFSFKTPGTRASRIADSEAGLNSEDVEVAYRAIQQIPSMLAVEDDPTAIAALRKRIEERLEALMNHSDPVLRAAALRALAQGLPEAALRYLEAGAVDPHWLVRLSALSELKPEVQIPPGSRLRPLTADPDPLVRMVAVECFSVEKPGDRGGASG